MIIPYQLKLEISHYTPEEDNLLLLSFEIIVAVCSQKCIDKVRIILYNNVGQS